MKRHIFILGVSVLLCAFCTSFAAQKITRVACVGDSITAGNGIKNKEMDTYPSVLQEMLGSKFEVKNFGSSGRTLLKKGDYPYWVDGNYKNAIKFNPDIVIIKLGTNDSKPQNWQYKDEFIPNMREMISSFKNLETNSKIYLCTPMYVSRPAWGITEEIVHTDVCDAVKKVAKLEKLKLIDLHTMFEGHSELLSDGVHPNEAGAMRMSGILYKVLTGKNPPKLEPIRGKKFNESGFARLDMPMRLDTLSVVYPKQANETKSWLWIANDFEKLTPEYKKLLEAGYQLMFWKTPTRSKRMHEALDWSNEFYFYGVERFGLSRKIAIDFSGKDANLALAFAEKYSDRFESILLRNPELDATLSFAKIVEGKIPVKVLPANSPAVKILKDAGVNVISGK